MSDARVVTSAAELLQVGVDLVDVQCYAVSAEIDEESEASEIPGDVEPSYSLRIRHDGAELGVRLAARMYLGVGTVLADFAATYQAVEPIQTDEAMRLDFATNIGVMALIPYIRQAIADLTQRVFGQVVLLPIVQRGEISFVRDEPPAEEQ